MLIYRLLKIDYIAMSHILSPCVMGIGIRFIQYAISIVNLKQYRYILHMILKLLLNSICIKRGVDNDFLWLYYVVIKL